MATHSSILAWRIPWTEEPGGLQSMGSKRVRCDWVTDTFTFSEKSSFIAWPGQVGHSRLMPSELCVSTQGRLWEVLQPGLDADKHQGMCRAHIASTQRSSSDDGCTLTSLEWRVLYQVVNTFPLLGVLVLPKSSKILLCISHKGKLGPCPKSVLSQLCPTLCSPMDCSMPGSPSTSSQSLPKLMSIESLMPSNHLILCRHLLLLPSIFPSIRVFSSESVLPIRWPKYWSFGFSISPSNEYAGFISFRIDWLDLLAVWGTLKSLLQHYSSKASILWCSAFFIVQLSHSNMTTGKTIALTRQTFVSKVMSLFFNMLSRLVIAFLPKSKCLLLSWLQSPSAVILEPKKIKSVTVSIVSPSICHEVMGPDAMIIVFWMLSFKLPFSLSSFTFSKRLFDS